MPQIKLIPIKVKPDHLSPKRYKQAFDAALDEAESGVLADYQKTVRTFTHKPPFYSTRSQGTLIIFTPDKIYNMLDAGTRPHLIFPKRARALRFRGRFRSKTTPRVIGSRQGSKSGKVVFSKGVIHPGTQAREFHKMISEKWIKKFPPILNRHLKTAAL